MATHNELVWKLIDKLTNREQLEVTKYDINEGRITVMYGNVCSEEISVRFGEKSPIEDENLDSLVDGIVKLLAQKAVSADVDDNWALILQRLQRNTNMKQLNIFRSQIEQDDDNPFETVFADYDEGILKMCDEDGNVVVIRVENDFDKKLLRINIEYNDNLVQQFDFPLE